MIISFLAPTGGVGSTTLAVLAASFRAAGGRVLLVDGAPDPAVDLYTSTENSLPETQGGRLTQGAVPVRWTGGLSCVRRSISALPGKEALLAELFAGGYTDCILDAGVTDPFELETVLALSDKVVVVLTQDNAILRASDRLLGEIRALGGRAGFLINKWEARDPAELGDTEEIFDLIEEDYYGSVSLEPGLRYLMNQGRPEQALADRLPELKALWEQLKATIESEDEPEDVPDDEPETQAGLSDGAAGESTPTPAGEEAPVRDGVLQRIRSFFRIGKGN